MVGQEFDLDLARQVATIPVALPLDRLDRILQDVRKGAADLLLIAGLHHSLIGRIDREGNSRMRGLLELSRGGRRRPGPTLKRLVSLSSDAGLGQHTTNAV